MNFKLPEQKDLQNESDVEQKFLYLLLTGASPYGFGIPPGNIQTKSNIRRFKIGKGSDTKLYFPDYLVVTGGLPMVVIEAKTPGEDLVEAFREARLYATELNAIYPSGLNPASIVLASDGLLTFAGRWDQAEPQYRMPLKDVNPYSEEMAKLQKLMDAAALDRAYSKLSKKIKHPTLKKPRRLVGGQSVQQEEIGHNSFGATIAADYGGIFNPSSRTDRAFIAKHGYIPSRRRERYIDPIDRVMRASTPLSETHAKTIEDTGSPTEVVEVFRDPKPLEHQVLLIVGGVGAGKTTFVDYLQEVALPRELIEKTIWIRLDMNLAPISVTEIYDWLRKTIENGCRESYPELDFDDLEILKSVFSVEINKFRKGVGKLYESDENLFKVELAKLIVELQSNAKARSAAYSRYCGAERGKLLVIVLDNCDKRTRDEQLLMFQAAQWIQKEFRALVVLPLREQTYDNHRDQPPLDTALKDLVFRIEAPLFHHVLVSRVQLALNAINSPHAKKLHYDLPNGIRVEYQASDQAFYLTSILKSIFEYDRYIRRMIVGLSARNIRRALEIFLEFCTSGHIGEDQIFKIRQAEGQYTLPLFLVTRVLLRLNRRFYDSDHSYLKNLFAADKFDDRPGYFTRLMILKYLYGKFSQVGPTGLKGYFAVRDIKLDVAPHGVPDRVMNRELEYLLKGQCIVSEDFRTEGLNDEDLIKLAPAGFVHLEMIGNVDYLAAVAEDTWFSEESIAQGIALRIGQVDRQYQAQTTIYNAKDLVNYLDYVRERDRHGPETFLESSQFGELTDLSEARAVVAATENTKVVGPWINSKKKYPAHKIVKGRITGRKTYGLFVELEHGLWGLLHRSKKLPIDFEVSKDFLPGELIDVEILSVDPINQKMELAYSENRSISEQDAPGDWAEQ